MILILGIGLFYINSIIKTAVNELGPKMTQTYVRLDRFSFSPIDASLAMQGLKIGNPKGFNLPYALQLGSVKIRADRNSLFSDVIVIDSVELSGIDVSYELSGKTSNLAILNKNITDYISLHAGTEQSNAKSGKNAEEKKSSSKKVIIKHLSVTGAKVNLSASLTTGGKAVATTIRLPEIQLKDLGSEKQPMSIEQTAAYILNLISINSLDTLTKSAYKNVLNISQQTIDQTKQAAEEVVDSAKQTVQTLKEKGENINSSFKDLFGRSQ